MMLDLLRHPKKKRIIDVVSLVQKRRQGRNGDGGEEELDAPGLHLCFSLGWPAARRPTTTTSRADQSGRIGNKKRS